MNTIADFKYVEQYTVVITSDYIKYLNSIDKDDKKYSG